MNPEYDFLIKIDVIGDSQSGITAMIKRYADGVFDDDSLHDFKLRTIELNDKQIKLHLNDLSSSCSARQRGMRGIMVAPRNDFCHAIVLCVDLSQADALHYAQVWLNECSRYASDPKVVTIVATKQDTYSPALGSPIEQLQTLDISQFTQAQVLYKVASAQTGDGVKDVFSSTARETMGVLQPDIFSNESPAAAAPPPAGTGAAPPPARSRSFWGGTAWRGAAGGLTPQETSATKKEEPAQRLKLQSFNYFSVETKDISIVGSSNLTLGLMHAIKEKDRADKAKQKETKGSSALVYDTKRRKHFELTFSVPASADAIHDNVVILIDMNQSQQQIITAVNAAVEKIKSSKNASPLGVLLAMHKPKGMSAPQQAFSHKLEAFLTSQINSLKRLDIRTPMSKNVIRGDLLQSRGPLRVGLYNLRDGMCRMDMTSFPILTVADVEGFKRPASGRRHMFEPSSTKDPAPTPSTDEALREPFVCPITRDIMNDPVIAADGYTYERTAITQALAIKAQSPMNRQPMTADSLLPNRALKDAIDAWKEQHLASGPSASPG